MSDLKKRLRDTKWALPIIGGLGLLWAASRPSRSAFVTFTSLDGSLCTLRGSDVYLVHISPYSFNGRPMTRIRLTGLEDPVDVREVISEVTQSVGGDWASFEGLGSWFGCSSSTIQVFLDASCVVSVDASGMRRSRDLTPLTDITLEGGYKVRVTENLQQVRSVLGI